MRDDVEQNAGVASHILAQMSAIAEDDNAHPVKLEEIIAGFGESSFIPAMLVPALMVVSPLSGIPFLSSAMGLTIALVAAQMIMGRKHLWLPNRLNRVQINRARLQRSVKKLRPMAGWLDRRLRPRWRALTASPLHQLIGVLCMLCGLSMPFLELVPFSSSILGMAVICFGSGLMSRDGLLVGAGCVFMGLASVVPAVAFKLWGQVVVFMAL